ncbi:hypothetical protein ACQEU6_02085 [Spirillospora sp. CA-108201]
MELAAWQQDLNTVHKQVRARIEHAFAHMKWWSIPRTCRRKRGGVRHATRGIARMRNLPMAIRLGAARHPGTPGFTPPPLQDGSYGS